MGGPSGNGPQQAVDVRGAHHRSSSLDVRDRFVHATVFHSELSQKKYSHVFVIERENRECLLLAVPRDVFIPYA